MSQGCDACRADQYKRIQPEHEVINKSTLYQVYESQLCRLSLCYVHAVELFKLGEARFLGTYGSLATDIRVNQSKYAIGGNSDFI